MVLLHGGGMSWRAWHPTIRRAGLSMGTIRGDRVPLAELADLFADARYGAGNVWALASWTRRHGSITPITDNSYPIRIAWARRDRVIPLETYGHALMARLPGAELIVLDRVGHDPMYDDPDLVAHTILTTTTNTPMEQAR
jgi:pimeloyl-ACP methyl ester carboxylesterase